MILRRYLTKQVLMTTLAVLGFLVVVLLGGRVIRYLGMAAEGGLQVGFLAQLMAYNLPSFLEMIVPVSFFVALMLCFGRLYADNEMAVLLASGVSRMQLLGLVLPLAVAVFLAQVGLSVFAKPWGVREAGVIWQQQSFAQLLNVVQPNSFVTASDYHIYVGKSDKQHALLDDVMIARWSGDSTTLIVAKKAQAFSDENAAQLELLLGRRYALSDSFVEAGFERYRMTLEPKKTQDKQPKTEGVATFELGNTPKERAELGFRLSMPMVAFVAPLLALLLAKTNPRQGRWHRLVPALLVFVLFVALLIFLKNPIEKQQLGLWVYPVVLGLVLTTLVWRIRA